MFMDRKIQYCQDFSSSQFGLQIKCNLNQNPSNLICEYWQTDSKVYTERPKTQSSQHSIEEEDQSWRTDMIQLQYLV